jgi:thiamine biosynthesis lipoprotein
MPTPRSNRRDLLTGRAILRQAEAAQEALAAAVLDEGRVPQAGATVRLAINAMATEFGVLMNPGRNAPVAPASEALDLVHALERQLTVYRDDSEVSRLNATAAERPVEVSQSLFDLLSLCDDLTRMTDGAFDAATQAQITLWQRCRREDRVPTDGEIDDVLARSGMRHVRLDAENRTVAFTTPGLGFNFGAIGKGWALDRCAELMERGQRPEVGGQRPGVRDQDSLFPPDTRPQDTGRPDHQTPDPSLDSYCLHGGNSSVLARGDHNGLGGWPVGIGNPLFTSRRLGTILLKDRALGTSGSNIQYFRHNGTRYGHILDPRTARPARELLSVTVLAPSAATADALSTAFFVLGVEKARAVCDNQPLIGALLIPPPDRGGRLEPVVVGLPDEILFLDPDQVSVVR